MTFTRQLAVEELAEKLSISAEGHSQRSLGEACAIRVLHNIARAEGEPIAAMHWNHGMTYLGIGYGEIETEVERVIESGMATADDLLSVCDRMDEMLKCSEKLYAEIERFMPSATIYTEHDKVLSSWRGGFGTACINLYETHLEFRGGCKATTARIRAVIKRRDAIAAAAAKDAHEKSGMHDQLGMGI